MSVTQHRHQPIVIFTHEFSPKKGGIAIYVQEMAQALHKLNFPVEVFAPAHPRLKVNDFSYKVRALSCKGTQGWKCRLLSGMELLRIRNHLHNSILYLPEPGPIRMLTYLGLLSVIKPKRLILTLHGSEINRLSIFPHRKYLFNRLLNQCHLITVPSEYTGKLLVRKFPNAKEKLVLTPGALRSNLKVLGSSPENVTMNLPS